MNSLTSKLAIGPLLVTSILSALPNRVYADIFENKLLIGQSSIAVETLRNVRFSTSNKFIIMPVADKSGNSERQMGDVNIQKM